MKRILSLLCLSPAVLFGVDSVVTFNELQYHPPGASQSGEWIELHSQMSIDVDLSGWRISGGVDFTFPEGTIIPGRGWIVVALDPNDPALAGIAAEGPFSGQLSNGGETLNLRDRADRLMDTITYRDSGEWPIAADGSGATLAKKSGGLLSSKSASWRASLSLGGTPGAENFPPPGLPIQHAFLEETSDWAFLDGSAPPPANWETPSFDDSTWATGPAPLGSAGTAPSSLTVTDHLVERFRAADLAGVTDGQTFATWPDTATSDGQSQSATAGGNPIFVENATPSGQPAVRFDGNDEFRTSASPGIPANSGFVYFAVVKANGPPASGGVNDGNGAYLWDRVATTGNPLVSLKAQGGRFGFQKRFDNGSGIGGPVSTSAISTSDFQIVAIRRNRDESRFEVWVDGVLESSQSDTGAGLTPQPIVIGRHAANLNGGFDGDIAELLIYSDDLEPEEFTAVGAYLEGRYGLDTAFPGSTVATALTETSAPTYLRNEFNYTGDPAATSIRLNHTLGDGAVFYLNGVEISRVNMPAGPIDHNTRALTDLDMPASAGFVTLPGAMLAPGNNVLAVSLHPAAGNDSVTFQAALAGTESPLPSDRVSGPVFHEISPAGDPEFFVEVQNSGTTSLDLGDFTLVINGNTPVEFVLPDVALPPGGLHLVAQSDLGLIPADGDQLWLLPPGGRAPSDAKRVTNRLRGRAPGFADAWLFPEVATPGLANQFDLEAGIVINEICYNPPLLDPVAEIPPTIETIELIGRTANWRYNESGADLGSDWATMTHAVGGQWESGPGALAFDNGLDFSVGTQLTSPASNFPRVVTYYFESDFTLTGEQASGLRSLILDYAIDDGAIFYLNGVEVERFNMAPGPVTAATFASDGVGNATFGGPVSVDVPIGVALAGLNRFSVEVHQNTLGSSDISFGLEVSFGRVVDPGRPAEPARSSDEQWLELYNRSADEIDLSGWDFGEGIEFEFPFGTTLAAGDYLVVARDPVSLGGKHPAARILGPFSGSLSRGGETISLRDAHRNPADTLRYVDGGRWPGLADGSGSTLELTDPRADNSLPDAWAASDELDRTTWQTYRYRGTASASRVGPDNQWREFVFGLLEEGEILIDDISVIEDPDGAARQFLADGSFEGGNLSSWRFLGSHSDAEIVPDPSGGGNVLRLRATGSTGHMHNHVETTLANGERVTNGQDYEISFRARWLSGDPQLHTRLYFNRLAMKTRLTKPDLLGTPGAANSTAVSNLGPTGHSLSHSPVVPPAGVPVTVRIALSDPDGVDGATLFHRVNGGAFSSVPMSREGTTEMWTGTIPGESTGRVVQFYIESRDTPGATQFHPIAGSDSRAMYQVEDGRAATTCINNIRIIMDPTDQAAMYDDPNVMSNGRTACTVIDHEQIIYYDAGVRVKGSQRARTNDSRIGFNLGFPKDQLYRGVHRTVAIDRSEGQVVGQRELLFDLMATSSGGIPGEHNDLCYVISPDPAHTSAAILQMARFGSNFLESQFEDGSDGTVYEYELVYYPTSTNGAGFKLPQPDSVVGVDVTSLGDNPEDYRWTYLIKNNQEQDNLRPMMEMTALFDLYRQPGPVSQAQLESVLDVDQWLRALAYACATGAGDSYFSNSRHNGQFYARPDGKVLFFPHDNDFAFNANRGIFTNTELSEITRDPEYRRRYLGHLHDICTSVYNQAWMSRWTSHFDECVPGGNVFNDDLSYINSRSNYILGQVSSQVPQVPFSITTNGGNNFSSASSPVTISGQGWIEIDELRFAGSDLALPVTWTSTNAWQISVALAPGNNLISLEAYDFSGALVGTDSITVTATGASTLPSIENLVVSEIFYNPEGANEGAEFLEFLNISASDTLDLTGLQITDAVEFTFPGGTTLAPGERVVVVSNLVEFEARFGPALPVAGAFENQLANGGEVITLRLANGSLVRSFQYSDDPPWPISADGDGSSLVLAVPTCAPDHSLAESWRASRVIGGTPGTDEIVDYTEWKLGFGNPSDDADPDNDGWSVLQEFILGGSPVTRDQLSPIHLFDIGSQMLSSSVTVRAGVEVKVILQTSEDLNTWSTIENVAFSGSERLTTDDPVVDRFSFQVPMTGGEKYYRFSFEMPE